ncbi:MAG TPA: hypothetical protein VFP25_07625 [Nitrososphaeraceae archaeon]|nr:hypothetical protein [Nitrososphaeraceae archaeon]
MVYSKQFEVSEDDVCNSTSMAVTTSLYIVSTCKVPLKTSVPAS